jgi:hypothetical protein
MTASLVLGLFATGVAAVPASDSATIVNSGSTNVAGYTLDVRSDGTATAATSNRTGAILSTPAPFTLAPDVAKQFFADLAAARTAKAAIEPCMKSASFGSTTHVKWHDWTSPDLSCPPADPAATALAHDIAVITLASGVASSSRRNGPVMRQAPPVTPGTPEPSPTSS